MYIELIKQLTPFLLQLALVLSILLVVIVTVRKKGTVKKLESDNKELLESVLFLLATEDMHCEEHRVTQGQSLKNTMRKRVSTETKLSWSGKYSKSHCLKELEKLNVKSSKQDFTIEFLKGLILKAVK